MWFLYQLLGLPESTQTYYTTGALFLFRSVVHCSFVIQNEMMDVIYTYVCHNTTVTYHNTVTMNFQHYKKNIKNNLRNKVG